MVVEFFVTSYSLVKLDFRGYRVGQKWRLSAPHKSLHLNILCDEFSEKNFDENHLILSWMVARHQYGVWKMCSFFGRSCNNWRNGSRRKWKLFFFTNVWSKLHAKTTFWCHKSAVKNQQCNLYFLNLCWKVETAKDSKTFTYSALTASHWLPYFALYLISPFKFSISRSLFYFFICIIHENLFLVVCKFGFLWDIPVSWTPSVGIIMFHLWCIYTFCRLVTLVQITEGQGGRVMGDLSPQNL